MEESKLGFGVIYLVNSKRILSTIDDKYYCNDLQTIGPNYWEPNNRRIYVFTECVFTHTCYCVQVKLCYVKTVIYKIGYKFW